MKSLILSEIGLPQLPEAVTADWPIAEAGLNVRATHVLERQGIQTVGALRQLSAAELLKLPGMGAATGRHIRSYLQWLQSLAAGQLVYTSYTDMLLTFLTEDELKVIAARYGLLRRGQGASRNYLTLQQVGNWDGRSRERVRQVEEQALQKLRQRNAQLTLNTCVALFEELLVTQPGLYTAEDLEQAADVPFLGEALAGPFLLMLVDLTDSAIRWNGYYFTTLTAATLGTWDREIQELLPGSGVLTCSTALTRMSDICGAPLSRTSLLNWIRHHPEFCEWETDKLIRRDEGLTKILENILSQYDKPCHYAAILEQVNQSLRMDDHLTRGSILRLLNSSPNVARTRKGYYRSRRP